MLATLHCTKTANFLKQRKKRNGDTLGPVDDQNRVTRVTRMTRVNTVARVTTDQGNQDEVSIIIFCLSHHDFGLKRVTSV